MHGPRYQALIMVNKSQGHLVYQEDALLTSRMNTNPGGKQDCMWDGWFMKNGVKVAQAMVFLPNHSQFPNQPKGLRQVLVEHRIDVHKLWGKCKSKCDLAVKDCCCKRTLEGQPDFAEQKSLFQEVIEAHGHLCIFLLKFHCKLNFIKFFWGSVNKYLRKNCDYTFDTLKANVPKALESVKLETIHRWEHRMIPWMNAYHGGLSTAEAQIQVRAFSSKPYRSHRWVPETVARIFDQ